MHYMYHCKIRFEQRDIKVEDLRGGNRIVPISPAHIRKPQLVDGIALSLKTPDDLSGPEELFFFHMLFKDVQRGRILHVTRADDMEQYLPYVLASYTEKEKDLLKLVLFYLSMIGNRGFFLTAVDKLFSPLFTDCRMAAHLSPPLCATFSEKAYAEMNLDNSILFHADFSCGPVNSALIRSVTFTDQLAVQKSQTSCLALDMDEVSLPPDMLAADFCWKRIPSWEQFFFLYGINSST